MAPEVFLGKEYNQKADLWSIGVIIYFMYFNEYPFQNSNELLNGKLKKIPVDEEFKNLLLNLLKVEVVERISWKNFLKHPFILKYINKKMIDKEYYNFENEINNFFIKNNLENLLKKYPSFNDNNKYEVKKIETHKFKYYGEVIKINNEFISHGRGLIYDKTNNHYYKGQFQNGEKKGYCTYYFKTANMKHLNENFNEKNIIYFMKNLLLPKFINKEIFVKYEGEYDNGFNGNGYLYNSLIKFDGNFKSKSNILLEFDFCGIMLFYSSYILQGKISFPKFDGTGVTIISQYEKFEGNIKNNCLKGNVKRNLFELEKKIESRFEKNIELDGKKIITYGNGDIIEGNFIKDELTDGEGKIIYKMELF